MTNKRPLLEKDWIIITTKTFDLTLTGNTLSLALAFSGATVPQFSKIKSVDPLYNFSTEHRQGFDFGIIANDIKNPEEKFNNFAEMLESFGIIVKLSYSIGNLTYMVNKSLEMAVKKNEGDSYQGGIIRSKQDLSRDALDLYEAMKQRADENGEVKIGKPEWKNSLMHYMINRFGWTDEIFSNTLLDLQENYFIEPIFPSNKKDSPTHSAAAPNSEQINIYQIYENNIATDKIFEDTWTNVQLRVTGIKNAFPKKVASYEEANKNIGKKYPYSPKNYVIFDTNTFEILWKGRTTYDKALIEKDTLFGSNMLVKLETYVKQYEKFKNKQNDWWLWRVL